MSQGNRNQNRNFRPRKPFVPLNEAIQASELRVIGSEGEQLGIMSTYDALRQAREQELDLLVIVPNQNPPVARILNYGKHKFEQGKQDKESKRKNKAQSVHKEVKMSPRIGEHDFEVRVKRLTEFLEAGHKVRVLVEMRGREQQHPEIARNILVKILGLISSIGKTERLPAIKQEGRAMTLQLVPLN